MIPGWVKSLGCLTGAIKARGWRVAHYVNGEFDKSVCGRPLANRELRAGADCDWHCRQCSEWVYRQIRNKVDWNG